MNTELQIMVYDNDRQLNGLHFSIRLRAGSSDCAVWEGRSRRIYFGLPLSNDGCTGVRRCPSIARPKAWLRVRIIPTTDFFHFLGLGTGHEGGQRSRIRLVTPASALPVLSCMHCSCKPRARLGSDAVEWKRNVTPSGIKFSVSVRMDSRICQSLQTDI
jgi:hypothetical protein